MSEDAAVVLTNALNEVDRVRKRQILVFVILFVAEFAGLVWLVIADKPQTDIRELLVGSVVILVWTAVYAAIAVSIHVTRMTKRVLKAIELASRK